MDGRTVWSMKEIEGAERTRVATLLDAGCVVTGLAFLLLAWEG